MMKIQSNKLNKKEKKELQKMMPEIPKEFGFREDFNPYNRFDLKTIIKYKDKKYVVSTVDLGIDHSFGFGSPLFYETMIFGYGTEENPFDGYQIRYTTKKQAIRGHKKTVKMLKKGQIEELLSND